MSAKALIIAGLAAFASALPQPQPTAPASSYPSGSASVTPHEQYGSAIGVLGCLIDTNRVAYWPMQVDCNNICVQLNYQGNTLNVLHIDTSGGAYDISYDAWNQLVFNESATADPQMGGGFEMTYQFQPMSECADLIKTPTGNLPLMAANSINYVAECFAQPNSWAATHYDLYNIADDVCLWGKDEICTGLNLAAGINQAHCPSGLGNMSPLNMPVMNIAYGTGVPYKALG